MLVLVVHPDRFLSRFFPAAVSACEELAQLDYASQFADIATPGDGHGAFMGEAVAGAHA
jgi:hypothetical protein